MHTPALDTGWAERVLIGSREHRFTRRARTLTVRVVAIESSKDHVLTFGDDASPQNCQRQGGQVVHA
ncbi:hypothetical protein GCM10027167_49570 [Nocardia heshunensis]